MLKQMGLVFSVLAPRVDEFVQPAEIPHEYVIRLACEKAAEVKLRCADASAVVLGADTAVVLGGNILGKPESKQHGLQMLRALSGETHQVITGVAIAGVDDMTTFATETAVWFCRLEQDEIEYYWDTGEPLDKAGGYGLQGIGAAFVNKIEGSYSNVIGLPLAETLAALRKHGVRHPGASSSPMKEFESFLGGRHG